MTLIPKFDKNLEILKAFRRTEIYMGKREDDSII